MAINFVQPGAVIKLPVASGKTSGDPDLVGDIPVVCLTDRDSDGNAECALTGVFDLPVTGANNAGNAGIAVGATLYMAGGTINVDSTDGTQYGVALKAVASGGTDTINVRLKG